MSLTAYLGTPTSLVHNRQTIEGTCSSTARERKYQTGRIDTQIRVLHLRGKFTVSAAWLHHSANIWEGRLTLWR